MITGNSYTTLFTALKTSKKAMLITSLLAAVLLCGVHANAQTTYTSLGVSTVTVPLTGGFCLHLSVALRPQLLIK